MEPKDDETLWHETVLGVLLMVVGAAGIGLMIWRESYNAIGLTACAFLLAFGGGWTNKLRAGRALESGLKIIESLVSRTINRRNGR